MKIQYDHYNFVYIKDSVTILENENTEIQTHYFHLGSICRISRACEEKTVIYFDNGSFIIIRMNDEMNHDFTTKWATAVFEGRKYEVKTSSTTSSSKIPYSPSSPWTKLNQS